jgi:hypothetical protein
MLSSDQSDGLIAHTKILSEESEPIMKEISDLLDSLKVCGCGIFTPPCYEHVNTKSELFTLRDLLIPNQLILNANKQTLNADRNEKLANGYIPEGEQGIPSEIFATYEKLTQIINKVGDLELMCKSVSAVYESLDSDIPQNDEEVILEDEQGITYKAPDYNKSKMTDCPKCKGKGYKMGLNPIGINTTRKCMTCNGSGMVHGRTCVECNGKKKITYQRSAIDMLFDGGGNKSECSYCDGKGYL